jgi:hypothetical protein
MQTRLLGGAGHCTALHRATLSWIYTCRASMVFQMVFISFYTYSRGLEGLWPSCNEHACSLQHMLTWSACRRLHVGVYCPMFDEIHGESRSKGRAYHYLALAGQSGARDT